MRRYLGVDISDMELGEAALMVAEATEVRRMDVSAMAEAIALAFGAEKQ